MKKIIVTIIFIFAVLNSCEKKLDTTPTYLKDIEDIVSTSEGLEYLKNGAYAYARRAYARYFIHFAEMLADTGEINFVGSYSEFRDLWDKNLVNTFLYSEESWEVSFIAINNANLVIDHLDVVEDETSRAILEADAKFIRGLLYFDLVRLFGFPYGPDAMTNTSVPLVIKGVKTPDDITYPSKATNQAVFSQVESDLLFAYNNLPDDEIFYASKYSAAAILSRYYLTVEDYSKAAAFADSVISSGVFLLSGKFLDAFNHQGNTAEDIFTWQQTELDNEGEYNEGLATFYASTDEAGRSDMEISYDIITSVYDSTDSRGFVQFGVEKASKITDIFYEGFGSRAYGGIYTAKWLDYKTNVTMVRLAEMYLTRAEANQMIIENGGSPDPSMPSPTDDIKVIRARAGVDITGNTLVTIEEIRLERYKELIFEGHRLHDYKRWKRTIWDLNYNDEALIVPIPKKELDANPNLQ